MEGMLPSQEQGMGTECNLGQSEKLLPTCPELPVPACPGPRCSIFLWNLCEMPVLFAYGNQKKDDPLNSFTAIMLHLTHLGLHEAWRIKLNSTIMLCLNYKWVIYVQYFCYHGITVSYSFIIESVEIIYIFRYFHKNLEKSMIKRYQSKESFVVHIFKCWLNNIFLY